MSAAAGRTAGKVGQAIGRAATKANASANEAAGAGGSAAQSGKDSTLNKGAKRDPELYVRPDYQIRFHSIAHVLITDFTDHHDRCLWYGWLSLWPQADLILL